MRHDGETVVERTQFRLSVGRLITAPAAEIFGLVASPAGQLRIDGSHMLVGPDADRVLTAAGDTFAMEMDREPLGDVPMGRYRVENLVTRFALNSGIEWCPYFPGETQPGYVWGWALVPAENDQTHVTNYCDWTVLRADWRSTLRWPVLPAEMMLRSLDNLQRLVENAPAPT